MDRLEAMTVFAAVVDAGSHDRGLLVRIVANMNRPPFRSAS